MRTGRLLSVNIGHVVEVDQDGPYRTAIDKRAVPGPVAARRLGLAGDRQLDTEHHGGVDQAVYAYAREDLDWWAAQLGRELSDGQFGENLTTTGLDLAGAVVGERWRVGTAVLEVSCPRIPCRTFQAWIGESRWVRRFTEAGRSGTYLRVLTEGEVRPGDAVTVEHRPAHGVTIDETFRAFSGDHSLAARLLEAPELPAEAHRRARRWLETAPTTT